MKDKPTIPEYVPTETALAGVIGISAVEWNRKWSKREGRPPKTARGWHVAGQLAWYQAGLRANAANQSGINSDIKRTKIEKEVEKIQGAIHLQELEIAEKRGQVVSIEAHGAALRELATILKDTLAQFVGNVKVLTGDVKLVKDAERLRDTAYENIRRRVEK